MAIKPRIVYYYEVFLRNSLRRDNILGLKYRVESSFGGLGLGAYQSILINQKTPIFGISFVRR